MLKALIVTVAYNPPNGVVKNLEVDYYPHLVIDNSERETIWLKEYCQSHGHIYQWLGDNLGIAKALNTGAEYAIKHGFEYIVTMDQDSELTNEILANMDVKIFNYLSKKQVAIFSPVQVSLNEKYLTPLIDFSEDIYTMTSGNFLRLDIWNKIGGFDDDLFIDLVDFDYNARATINGYKIIKVNSIVMKHFVGDHSTVKWFGKYGFDVWNHGKIRKYYQARNFYYIYNKYHGVLPEVLRIKKIIRKMPLVILLFECDKLNKIWYYFLGVADYYRGRLGKFK